MLATFTTSGAFSSKGRLSSRPPSCVEPAGAAEPGARLGKEAGSGAVPTTRPAGTAALEAPAPGGSARFPQPASEHETSATAAERPRPDHAVLRRKNHMGVGPRCLAR